MLYIQKGKEPSSLTRYRKKRFAYFDGYPDKDDIRNQLLKEQGFLCAYCMRRISIEKMKIEHWYPEDKLTDVERLNYGNMLGACEGHKEGTKGSDDTCDTHKANTEIKVNPTCKETLGKIKYKTSTGEIYSEDEDIQKDLNVTLNLNSNKHMLKLNRKATLESVISQMSRLQQNGNWSRRIVENMLKQYQGKDSEGKKKEYAGIVVWYLEKKLAKFI